MTDLRQAALEQQAEPVATFQDGVLEGQLREREYWVKQQAEPTCPDCKTAVLYECVACSSNNYPPKQQAEPVACKSCQDIGGNWAWKCNLCGEVDESREPEPPQRQWVGLTEDDIAQAMCRADAIFTGPMQFKFAKELEAKLKERNA